MNPRILYRLLLFTPEPLTIEQRCDRGQVMLNIETDAFTSSIIHIEGAAFKSLIIQCKVKNKKTKNKECMTTLERKTIDLVGC